MNLKRLMLIFIVAVLMFTVKIGQTAEYPVSTNYWYQVIMDMPRSDSYLGSSSLPENEFIMLVNGQAPILLSNLVVMDSMGKMKAVSEVVPFLKNSIYLNPKYIIAVYPLKGDPRTEK
ncbi:MAG: hypothetical protein NT014_04545 [Candidatus Omnitrophica bacterium]|nr:hypothetical protein [Candidatus Omnitrophota bacterium]